MSSSHTNYITLLLILIISFFYIIYLLKWESIILGVIKELILLPSILFQFGLSFYFIIKILREKKKRLIMILNFIFTLLVVYSFVYV